MAQIYTVMVLVHGVVCNSKPMGGVHMFGCVHLPSHVCHLQFKDGSYHIAFDKGALDALMGEDTEGASTAGSKLLSEVQRVLDPSEGQYICVTLGQPHVLSKHSWTTPST